MSLKELRQRAGLSQKQAAALVGVCPKTWWNYEHGKTRVPAGTAALFEINALMRNKERT